MQINVPPTATEVAVSAASSAVIVMFKYGSDHPNDEGASSTTYARIFAPLVSVGASHPTRSDRPSSGSAYTC